MALTTGQGGFPAGWSFPANPYNYCTGAYASCGMGWVGKKPASMNDIVAVIPYANSIGVDVNTLCGTTDPDYTTQADILKKTDCYKAPVWTP